MGGSPLHWGELTKLAYIGGCPPLRTHIHTHTLWETLNTPPKLVLKKIYLEKKSGRGKALNLIKKKMYR